MLRDDPFKNTSLLRSSSKLRFKHTSETIHHRSVSRLLKQYFNSMFCNQAPIISMRKCERTLRRMAQEYSMTILWLITLSFFNLLTINSTILHDRISANEGSSFEQANAISSLRRLVKEYHCCEFYRFCKEDYGTETTISYFETIVARIPYDCFLANLLTWS